MKDFKQTEKTIKNYWINREERANHALNHLKYIESKYKDQILYCINNSEVFDDSVPFFKGKELDNQYFINTDSISAAINALDLGYQNVCILNFASYKHPGGGFLGGSSAQEEALCHESILYSVLSSDKLKGYYEYNNQHLNNGLYENRAVYTKDIVFERSKPYTIDVLTCAAPNVYTAQRYKNITDQECFVVLKSRIEFILRILSEKAIKVAVLGAFGCGVFGNNPQDLINIYKHIKWPHSLKCVIHAVPGDDLNAKLFKQNFVSLQNDIIYN